MVPQVLELEDILFSKLVVDDRNGQWAWFICQEIAVVCRLQMKLQVLESLALDEIDVVRVLQDAALETANEAFQVAIVYIEHDICKHFARLFCVIGCSKTKYL